MSKYRTSSYAFTVFNPNNKDKAEGLDELKKLRKTIAYTNKLGLTNHYVKCQGRWGKKNPNYNRRTGKKNPNYNRRTIPFCPLRHAVKWDVYFYRM